MNFRNWMTIATEAQITRLARRVKTSSGYLRQIASGHRRPSADMAGRIEVAIADINRSSTLPLPGIDRTHLCEACNTCPFAQQHKEKSNG